MKVILLQDIKGMGKKGDLATVSDGYARNYLLPRKLVMEANAQAMAEYNSREAARKHREEVERDAASQTASKLNGQTVKVTAKAGTSGRLFGSVTAGDIADALKKKRIEVDKKRIELDAPIKQAGETQVSIRVYADTTAKITVAVKIAE